MQDLFFDYLDIGMKIFILVVFTIVLIIFQRIVQEILNRGIKRKTHMALDDLSNMTQVLIRLGAGIVFLYFLFFLFEINDPNILFGISTLIGAIISFSSIQAIQNFIAGLFILFTRPFGVQDFIAVGNTEGIVVEISLNYTKLRTIDNSYNYIPNKNIIKSQIINYNRKVAKKEGLTKLNDLTFLKGLFDDNEIVRYAIQWGAPLGDLEIAKQKIESICQKYEKIFGVKPEFFLFTVSHRMEFRFTVIADEADIVLNNITNFRDEIITQFH